MTLYDLDDYDDILNRVVERSSLTEPSGFWGVV